MNMHLRLVLFGMIGIATLMALWLAVPSSLFVQPVGMKLQGTRLTIVRETPLGDVTVDWVGEIYLVGRDGYECAGQGVSVIQRRADNLYSGEIGGWAMPCVEAGPPFVLQFQYSVRLFGIIPLRPVHFATTVTPAEVAP